MARVRIEHAAHRGRGLAGDDAKAPVAVDRQQITNSEGGVHALHALVEEPQLLLVAQSSDAFAQRQQRDRGRTRHVSTRHTHRGAHRGRAANGGLGVGSPF
eukprot:6901643-Prymnesium_polylepis.1